MSCHFKSVLTCLTRSFFVLLLALAAWFGLYFPFYRLSMLLFCIIDTAHVCTLYRREPATAAGVWAPTTSRLT